MEISDEHFEKIKENKLNKYFELCVKDLEEIIETEELIKLI